MHQKADVLSLLDSMGISYTVSEHPAVFTIEELYDHDIPERERIAKNLFLRDDKKRSYYLISIPGEMTADLKNLRKVLGSRPLSFASVEDLKAILNLEKGEVTPFGALDDVEHRTVVRISSFFRDGIIGVHPNTNTATVFLKATDLVRVLQENGTDISFMEL